MFKSFDIKIHNHRTVFICEYNIKT